ncbi:methyltransferase domain-containing protein [Aestuariivirga sp.]|uniref:methyltransferase domain-containing protein n=1 Tax=Aestuariivirga sp. TaxID=2650926 RepID=UPI00391BDD55
MQRIDAVVHCVMSLNARTVLDLGCGEGAALLKLVCKDQISRILGIDKIDEPLDRIRRQLDRETDEIGRKAELRRASFLDLDETFAGFDVAILIETIEHIDPARLSLLEQSVFGNAAPEAVIITTPDRDQNARLGVPPHRFRHPDHRFEWGRRKLEKWAAGVARRWQYNFHVEGLSTSHSLDAGATQMVVFRKA